MKGSKKYWWLRLYADFFDSMRIKKLRRLPKGDTLLVIYLKLQLKAIAKDGVLAYEIIDNDIAEELALDIDEKTDDVKVCLEFLFRNGLAEPAENGIFLPYAVENTGSEGASAERMRTKRAQSAQESAQSGTMCAQCAPTLAQSDVYQYQEKEKEKNQYQHLDLSIREQLKPQELEKLDNELKDLDRLLDLIDQRKPNERITNPYAYVMKAAREERWSIK